MLDLTPRPLFGNLSKTMTHLSAAVHDNPASNYGRVSVQK